jgi:hypothetical protein
MELGLLGQGGAWAGRALFWMVQTCTWVRAGKIRKGQQGRGWILRVRDTCGSWHSLNIEGTCGASACVPIGMGIP